MLTSQSDQEITTLSSIEGLELWKAQGVCMQFSLLVSRRIAGSDCYRVRIHNNTLAADEASSLASSVDTAAGAPPHRRCLEACSRR